ncbi:hypothetical protein LPJ55_002333 [Coemansia sp. RSA 990]|nr:hypothetical protein LPJ55_002333 [Coemansia sp. RSA 990]KAJ2671328.1 hypothetical protein IWW42_003451 [Coemansia sp. RSA 1085]
MAVSDPKSAWRAFSCLVPFTTSDNTPFLMLYGGTSTTGETDPLKLAEKGSTSLQVFNLKNSKWYEPNTANTPESGPVLPGCGAASGDIWVYNPQYGVPNKASTSVSLLDNVHWSWSTPTQQGQLPVPRFGAAFAYVPEKQAFYMHGGIALDTSTNTASSSNNAANNLDILSPGDLKWNYASNGPARVYHTLCYLKSTDTIVLFGGADGDAGSYNDVKLLSTQTNTWEYAVNVNGDAPSKRLLHSAVCTDDTMFVFGGVHSIDDKPSDSAVWMLKANSDSEFTWSKAPISGSSQSTGPVARAGHSAAIHDGQMYIYGGFGSGGQDSTMYKLDLSSWQWSRTDITGSNGDLQKDNKNKTAVLIAAIVSSVLGVVVVGITTAVIFRIIRRRSRKTFGGRRQSDAHDSLASNNDQAPNTALVTEHKESNDLLRPDSRVQNTPDNSAVATTNRPLLPQFSPGSDGNTANTMPPNSSSEFVDDTPPKRQLDGDKSRQSPADSPMSMSTGQALLGGDEDGERHLLNTMRARARSLSNKLAHFRQSAAFSDATTPTLPSTSGRRKHTDATLATTGNRQSVAISQDMANMYGADYLRLENEYRQAEAINEILLSGQPIPAWLRDAVNQVEQVSAQQTNSNGNSPESPAAESARRLMIANKPSFSDA